MVICDLMPEDLKAIRKEQMDMSVKQFADALGFSKQLIESWETGRVIPSYEAQQKICELAGVAFLIRPEKKHPLMLKKQGSVNPAS
jgi:transcriptional regulator with XRE-family HTH domain